jgi:hypothetical protein
MMQKHTKPCHTTLTLTRTLIAHAKTILTHHYPTPPYSDLGGVKMDCYLFDLLISRLRSYAYRTEIIQPNSSNTITTTYTNANTNNISDSYSVKLEEYEKKRADFEALLQVHRGRLIELCKTCKEELSEQQVNERVSVSLRECMCECVRAREYECVSLRQCDGVIFCLASFIYLISHLYIFLTNAYLHIHTDILDQDSQSFVLAFCWCWRWEIWRSVTRTV